MSLLRELLARVRASLGRRGMERRLDEEMEFHLGMLEQEAANRGLRPDEAQLLARRQLGGADQTREAWRDRLGFPWINDFLQDLRYAVRGLRAAPGFTTAVVLSFALGIAVNTFGYVLVDTLYLVRLPYPELDRLVIIEAKTGNDQRIRPRGGVTYRDFQAWSDQSHSFDVLAARRLSAVSFRTTGPAQYVTAERVTTAYFEVLGTRPAVGRSFSPEEGKQGWDGVVVLSHKLWSGRFGADPGVLGNRVWVDGQARTVIGIMPEGFTGLVQKLYPDLWLPLTEGAEPVMIVARLNHSSDLTAAQAEITALVNHTSKTEIEIRLMQAALGQTTSIAGIVVLPVAVELVFVIACVNVAGLLLARGNSRLKEIALRASLGAGRMRIVRQLLTESLLMSSLGCLAGVGLSGLWLRCLGATIPPETAMRFTGFSMNWKALAIAAMATITAAVLSGLGPALAVSRGNLNPHLSEGYGAPGPRRRRWSRLLVATEVTLTLVLLAVPLILILGDFSRKEVKWTGPANELLTVTVEPWKAADREPDQLKVFYGRLLETVRRAPGVRSAALASDTPLRAVPARLTIGRCGNDSSMRVAAGCRVVSPGYLETTSTPLLTGRFFTRHDDVSTEQVVVINQGIARQFWGGRSPLGDCLMLRGERRIIIGVVADTAHGLQGIPAHLEVMVPYLQVQGFPLRVVVRVLGDPSRDAETITRLLYSLDPDQPITEVRTLEQRSADDNREILRLLGIFGAFALGALMLSGVGLHGLLSYSVSERVRETGIRLALGGSKARVVWQVLRGGLLPAGVGLILGFWMAVLCSVALMLQGGGPARPAWQQAFEGAAGAALLVLLICLWACYGPARRAAAAEPMTVLRCE